MYEYSIPTSSTIRRIGLTSWSVLFSFSVQGAWSAVLSKIEKLYPGARTKIRWSRDKIVIVGRSSSPQNDPHTL